MCELRFNKLPYGRTEPPAGRTSERKTILCVFFCGWVPCTALSAAATREVCATIPPGVDAAMLRCRNASHSSGPLPVCHIFWQRSAVMMSDIA